MVRHFRKSTDLSLPIHTARREWRWIAERAVAISLAAALSAYILFSFWNSIMQHHNRWAGMHIATAINIYNVEQPGTPISSVQEPASLYERLGGKEALHLSYARFEEALSSITLRTYGYNKITAVYSPPGTSSFPDGTSS